MAYRNTQRLAFLAVLGILLLVTVAPAQDAEEKDWPAVLKIDDFENGLDLWDAQDTGTLELVDDAPQGAKALRWTARDDGLGKIVLKALGKDKIDFSQYDLLMFRVKIGGKPIWNLDPVVHQHPHAYGFTAHYNSVDTLEGFGQWVHYVQDLQKWENAWPHTFDASKQEFSFDIHQLAGAGRTVVYLDQIELVRNTLEVQRSYRGAFSREADGSQVTRFRIAITNQATYKQTIRCAGVPGSLTKFEARLPTTPLVLPPGKQGELDVRLVCPPAVGATVPPYYGETLLLHVTSDETPGLVLPTELTAGTRPPKLVHPVVLSNPARLAEMRRQWAEADPAARKKDKELRTFASFVKKSQKALDHQPKYPLLAHPGDKKCPLDGKLVGKIDVPNLPFRRYQCPECGRCYSGPLFDAAADNLLGQHMANSGAVRWLGIAYAITGERAYAEKAAAILRGYIGVYLRLPIAAPSAGSPAYSATSGAVRIGATYMKERHWLTALAIGLDFIREANVLTDDELTGLREQVFAPSARLMLEHKVGVMNLQWMIAAAALYAGLATDDPQLVARAVYDHHGILNLIKWGYLPDGNWWENPSYQNVANGVAFPVLATVLHARLLPFDERLISIFKAAYRMYGPDGRGPTLGTGGPGGLGYSDNAVHSLAGLIDDPQLAWVAHNRRIWGATGGGGNPYDSYLWAAFFDSKPKLPKAQTTTVLPDKTTDFPDYGGIALRVPGQRNYCYLHYGRHLVHGHHNKLSINAYAKGGWFVRNFMGGYRDDFRTFLETIASSTSIMVDGKNADFDTGELLFHASGDWGEAASAREIGAWKDVEHERTVVLTKGPLIVLDRCLADKEHRYDWFYHSRWTKLSLDRTGLAEAPATLGDTPPYQSLQPLGKFPTSEQAHLTRKDGSGLRLAFADAGELFAFNAVKKADGLLWRRTGSTVGFAAVLWPYAKDEAGEARIERLPVKTAKGRPADLTAGQAVRVESPEGIWTVLVNYADAELRCGDLRSRARVTVHHVAPQ